MDPDPNPDLDPDPKFPEKSDPKKIISDPQHCYLDTKSAANLGAPRSTSARAPRAKSYPEAWRRSMAWKSVMSRDAAAADM